MTNPQKSKVEKDSPDVPAPMKTKSLALLLIFLVSSTVIMCLFSNQRPTIHSIITETHKQLSNLKNLKENLKKVNDPRELLPDPKYLIPLGFTTNPRLLPEGWGTNHTTLPVIVTGVASGQVDQAVGFIRCCRHFVPEHTMLIYSLDVDASDANTLNQYCNSSSCTVRKFDFDLYPGHVKDLSTYAYRPLVIQDALNQVGAILWLDVTHRLITNNLEPVIQHARQHGIASWSIEEPTSALTHPRMFDYFHAQQENYFFHHMVEPSHVLLLNTQSIHNHLMLPWVQCSLIPECIAPIGAQRTGCRFDKKPLYRYSGCHRYDMSAFNVVLGIMFDFNDNLYVVDDHIFRLIDQELSTDNSENATNLNTRTESF